MVDATPRKPHYVFLPTAWQRGRFLVWLKRTHAWTGFFGALMFVVMGSSGLLLNHRSVMKIDTGQPEVTKTELSLEPWRFASREDFVAWMSTEHGRGKKALRPRTPPADQVVLFNGTEVTPAMVWEARFWGPNAMIEGYFRPETGLLSLELKDYTLGGLMKELHKGHGVGIAFILLIDAVAGALLLMSLSGLLLWSRFHGPRLAALGILGACATWLAVALWPSVIVASF